MGPGTSYEVRPESVRSVTNNVASLVSQAAGVVDELASTVVDGGAFATIGGPVASANNTMHRKQVDLLGRLTKLLEEVNQLVNQATDGYENTDNAVADGYGGNGEGQIQLAQAQIGEQDPGGLANDDEFRNRLADHEDRREWVYNDTEGHPTVGVGFNLDRADARTALAEVGADYDAVRAGRVPLTDAQIDGLLDRTVNEAVTTARDYYAGFDNLDITRQRVLADMAFNLGGPNLNEFQGMHAALEAGDYNDAADHMAGSLWADQVGRRADRLIAEMRTGQPQPLP
ncbi:MAG: glycoside hydrolase family protein [Micromonosporaceae bacterium]